MAAAAANNEFNMPRLSEIGAKMYLDKDSADVKFRVKNDVGEFELIPAHKVILSKASKEFQRMFYGDLKEEGDVTIVDASAAAFKEFLQCFYFNKVKLTIENVADVMNLSEKYHIQECVQACSELLQRDPTTETVCFVYQLAILFNRSELRGTCERFISKHSKEAFASAGFLACNRNVIAKILNIDAFSCSESFVFKSCMAWVKHVSRQNNLSRHLVQTHFGQLFYQIRYRSMSTSEFSGLLPAFGMLFSGDEYNDILQLITNKQFQSKLFNGNHRRQPEYEWNGDAVLSCNRMGGASLTPHNMKTVEITTFTTNKPLLLGQMTCLFLHNPKGKYSASYQVKVTIKRNHNRRTVILFHGDLCIDQFVLKLPRPLLIRQDVDHEIQLRMSVPGNTYFNFLQLKPEVEMSSDIVIRFSNDRMENGNRVGLIAGLAFNDVN